jgi:hypothetical protein
MSLLKRKVRGGEETDTSSNEQEDNMESGGPEDVNEETGGDGH